MDGLQAQWLLDPGLDMAAHIGAMIREWLTPEGLRAFESIPLAEAPAEPAANSGAIVPAYGA